MTEQRDAFDLDDTRGTGPIAGLGHETQQEHQRRRLRRRARQQRSAVENDGSHRAVGDSDHAEVRAGSNAALVEAPHQTYGDQIALGGDSGDIRGDDQVRGSGLHLRFEGPFDQFDRVDGTGRAIVRTMSRVASLTLFRDPKRSGEGRQREPGGSMSAR